MSRRESCDVRFDVLSRDQARSALEDVFGAMSPETRYLRYHSATPRLTTALARALTDIDGSSHRVWQARACDRAVGLVRLVDDADGIPELAVEVADEWAGRGIGTALVMLALRRARDQGIVQVRILVHPDNRSAIRLFRSAGARFGFRDGVLQGTIPVIPRTWAA